MDQDTQRRARHEFDEMVRDIRPDLHRYCARLVGSAIDGEDVVQDALARAYYQLSQPGGVEDLRGWLFRVAHNRAIDYLRRYDVRFGEELGGEEPAPHEGDPVEQRELAALGLSYFTKLTPTQRSCVILKDVLGYSLDQVSGILDLSVPAIKGALHRGRASLRRIAAAGVDARDAPLVLSPDESRQLERYVSLFNARDFDGLRDVLADDVRLDLVGRFQARGAEDVSGYFGRYGEAPEFIARAAVVEGHAAVLVSDTLGGDYGVLVSWDGERVRRIRDYRYARYVFAALLSTP